MRVLVLGASGMIGRGVFRSFSEDANFQTFGTIRAAAKASRFPERVRHRLVSDLNVLEPGAVARVLEKHRPDLVVNAVGVVKQLEEGKDPLTCIPLNAEFPHRLANLCSLAGARLVHISSDCVFSGKKGGYSEVDEPDATDLYGRTKILGELTSSPRAITLRTSTIGHEIGSAHGLLEWFLSQREGVLGFKRAIFSGLTTDEFARVIRDVVAPREQLSGLYHVSGNPVNKFELLNLLGRIYGTDVAIEPSESFVIDRSLDSSRFQAETGFVPKPWEAMIQEMYRIRNWS